MTFQYTFQYRGQIVGIKPLIGDIERHNGKYKVVVREGGNETKLILDGQGLLGKLDESGFDERDLCVISGPINRDRMVM